MSTGNRLCMHRTMLYRSPNRLVFQYADGTRAEFTDAEQIRWLLQEQDALVRFIVLNDKHSLGLFILPKNGVVVVSKKSITIGGGSRCL